MAVPVALGRLREIRGWLARLPPDAWIYDLRAPAIPRGLPYGLAGEPGHLCLMTVNSTLGEESAAIQIESSRRLEIDGNTERG